MSRYQKVLKKEQVEFLIKYGHLRNGELAKMFDTTADIIKVYKYRARKAGFNIPNQRKISKINQDFRELASFPHIIT